MRNNNIIDLILWLLKQRRRFRVEGLSMSPYLNPGDELLVYEKTSYQLLPSIEDLIVLYSPNRSKLRLVKRVVSVNKYGACFVRGDNILYSLDSRSFGWVEPQFVFGHVTSRFLKF